MVELAMAQIRMNTEHVDVKEPKPFNEIQRDQFLTSLYAVANADGNLSAEERAEIDAIALELGFPIVADEDGTRSPPTRY